jgi:Mycothiol maleylpyruvate isomerase N-terminal domain/MDMPI C-terminal domain
MSFYKRFFGSRSDRRGTDAELTMDLDLDFSESMEGIRNALAAFVSHARKAGLDAQVPTAPEWTVLDLVVHQGMVHRWATGHVLGKKSDPEALHAEGLASPDPVIWLHDGGLDLIRALQSAPADLEATVFLKNAPAPRDFWARRQCHETTIHSVDAQAAQLGRFPRAADTEVTRQIALDGIDELLNGFLTRSKSTLKSDKPVRLGIRADDVNRSWLVQVSDEPPVVERDSNERADLVLEGSAETLYLALWNRTDEISGKAYDFWRSTAKVSWS